jgi:squalene synthase HpnC
MTVSTIAQIERFGREHCEAMTPEQASAWCRRLAGGRYENFSVLSGLVPRALRADFAAVYAFCRWADDLGDELGDPQRSLEMLAWWRQELRLCFDGRPRHPVFVALLPAVRRHDLPMQPFDDLIAAFEQDQSVRRYETWDQLLGYCARSADPVGRLVLMLCGEERDERLFALSDDICTALQLTNHVQDVARDILQRDRIYIPREMIHIDDFERRLRGSAMQGFAVDHAFLQESRDVIRACVDRTWALFDRGAPLVQRVRPDTRPLVWLFAAGGRHVLRQIEMWNYETVLHRPTLRKPVKLWLVLRAMIMSKTGGFRASKGTAASGVAGQEAAA